MKRFYFILMTLFVAHIANAADDLSIIDVRRNIPLSDEEPIYKDFYINAGEDAGLKKNLVVTAVRKIMIRDSSGAQTYGEIEVPVGQLRILAIYGRVAVAREYKLLSRDENPMLEQIGLLVGDHLELKGSFVDNKIVPAPKRKTVENFLPPPLAPERKAASLPPAEPAPTAAPAVPPTVATPAASNTTSKAPEGLPAEFVKPTEAAAAPESEKATAVK